MSEKIVYLVQRYEMSLDDTPGLSTYPEKVFVDSRSAQEYCIQQDAGLKGFKYTCPCGCGDEHWRSWGYESIVMEYLEWSIWNGVFGMISWSDWEDIGVTKIIEEHPKDKYSPLTTELFVYGGTDEDVANLIFQKMPVAYTMFMVGNTLVEIESFGMKYNVRFSRREQ